MLVRPPAVGVPGDHAAVPVYLHLPNGLRPNLVSAGRTAGQHRLLSLPAVAVWQCGRPHRATRRGSHGVAVQWRGGSGSWVLRPCCTCVSGCGVGCDHSTSWCGTHCSLLTLRLFVGCVVALTLAPSAARCCPTPATSWTARWGMHRWGQRTDRSQPQDSCCQEPRAPVLEPFRAGVKLCRHALAAAVAERYQTHTRSFV